MDWLNVLSLLWYAMGIVFITGTLLVIVTAVWLFFEFYHTSVGAEDDPEQYAHKQINE
jgi:hypothetical protein